MVYLTRENIRADILPVVLTSVAGINDPTTWPEAIDVIAGVMAKWRRRQTPALTHISVLHPEASVTSVLY
ncbi:MAG: hypothetical protein U1F16_05300 [Turneriella sp.]